MKRCLWILLFIILGIGAVSLVAWTRRTSITAQFLRSSLKAPVKIGSIDFSPQTMAISNLWIGNPSSFRTRTAFQSRLIDITSKFSQLFQDPLVIDSIEIDDIFVGIEHSKGSRTNWSHMLSSPHQHKSSWIFKKKHYLIKRLTLRNLSIQVTQPNGQSKSYPTLEQMDFYNISDETGFPVHEIEKAIFNLMMQRLFDQLNLEKILPPLLQGKGSDSVWPLLIPKFFQK